MIGHFNVKLCVLFRDSTPILPCLNSHDGGNIYDLQKYLFFCSCPSFLIQRLKIRDMSLGSEKGGKNLLTLILRRYRTGTVWFYTSTSNKRAARPKLYTKSLTRDLKHMYSRFTLVRISINLQAPCVLYIGTGVSLLFRERFLYT